MTNPFRNVRRRSARVPASPALHPSAAAVGGGARRASRAFTLIELLVVMTIISLFIGAMGKLFSNSNGLTGLQAAENSLIGVINLARAQASLSQNVTRVLILEDQSTPDNLSHYLSRFLIVGPDPIIPNNWIPTGGAPVDLPPGIYVVPPGPGVPNHLPNNGAWPQNRWSQFSNNPTQLTVNGVSALYFYIEFNALGATTIPANKSNSNSYLGEILALGKATPRPPGEQSDPNPINFVDPDDINGIRISIYGTLTQLNDAQDFGL